jgi:hypothetical protein
MRSQSRKYWRSRDGDDDGVGCMTVSGSKEVLQG